MSPHTCRNLISDIDIEEKTNFPINYPRKPGYLHGKD